MFEFDNFKLDINEERLFSGDEEVPLSPRAFQVLVLLLENAGHTVKKDEFFEKIWSGSFVEENNLTVAISQVRRALGEKRCIETIPRRGYRFTCSVKTVSPEGLRSQTNPAKARLAFAICGLLALVAIGLTGWYFYKPSTIKKQRHLAVLPFTNLQPDPETDYLGYALADSMISKLAPIKILGVRPSQSVSKFVGQTPSPQQVANEIQADLLLAGTYQKIRDKIAFKVELIDLPTNSLLYSDDFEVPAHQLSLIQERLARRIISELGLTVSTFEKNLLNLSKPHSEEAYELYLHGIDYRNASQFPKAIEAFEKSTKLDPEFARTWVYLGSSYVLNASTRFGGKDHYDKARRAFEKALEINPESLRARTMLADMLIETNKVEEAAELLREAVKKHPDDPLVHWELSYAYRFAGLLEESKKSGEYAHEIDPGFTLRTSVPNYYLYLKEFAKYKASIPARFDSAYLSFYRGFVDYHLKEFSSAKIAFDRAYELDSDSLQSQIGKALSYEIGGKRSKAVAMLRAAEKLTLNQELFDAEGIYKIAQVYAVLGEKESAIRILRLSVENGFFSYPYISSDPLLENIREESAYKEILKVAQKRHEDFKTKFQPVLLSKLISLDNSIFAPPFGCQKLIFDACRHIL